ncbi:MAG: hypothetical protein CMK07_03565, partial [Ponticaulis sp.]|nr:hypothetical protein [Ponticaulis sp.]
GVRPRPRPVTEDGGPPAFARSSLDFNQVNMIIYPDRFSRALADAGETELRRTSGYVNDHIGVEVPDLELALDILRQDDVEVLEGISDVASGVRHAYILGPDNMVIELLEIDQP